MTEETEAKENPPSDKVAIPGEPVSLMTFERPPVSEKASDFIEGDEVEEVIDAEEIIKGPDDYRGTLDDKGNEYDPSVHAYPPKKTKGGVWSKSRKRSAPEINANAAFTQAAQQYAMLYGNAHVSLFGQNGAIDKEALAPLIDSIEAYMVENGISELDPKWQVLLAAGNYSTVICTRAPNAAKMKKWFSPVWNSIKRVFGFGKKKEVVPEAVKAQTDTIRENSADGFDYPEGN